MAQRFVHQLLLVSLGDQVCMTLAAEREAQSWIELHTKHGCLHRNEFRHRS
jgi:hypothetical protein